MGTGDSGVGMVKCCGIQFGYRYGYGYRHGYGYRYGYGKEGSDCRV